MPEFLLPARAQNLTLIEALTETTWNHLVEAIRPEIHGKYLEKTQRALSVNLNDAAVNYFWNAVEEDLRRKVIAYGIDYFASAVNKTSLRNTDDLREEVKAYDLVSGCFALGIIGDEAHFQLQHAREIRNRFSAAHEPVGEIDKMETLNFLKNCVKYALCFDPPAPGFQIKEFIAYLENENMMEDEVIAIMQAQSSVVYGPLLHNLFTQWIDTSSSAILKRNINVIAPELWKLADDKVRSEIGQRHASLKERPTPDRAELSLEFLKIVNGIPYIPTSLQFAIFKHYAERLIEAYFSWDNFHNEPAHARSLCELGFQVPQEAATVYSKAVMLSFIGNNYGYAKGAVSRNSIMVEAFTPTVVNATFYNLEHDAQVTLTLISHNPARRLKDLVILLRDKGLSAEQRKTMEFVESSNLPILSAHFRTIHAKLSKGH